MMKTLLKIAILGFLSLVLILSVFNPPISNAGWKEESLVVAQIFNIIEEQYLYPADLTKCRYDILKSLAKRPPSAPSGLEENPPCLDQYSEFMTPEEFEIMKTDAKGHFSGIGVEISQKDGKVVVISPIEDSPAFKAGVKGGDVILKVRQENEKAASDIKNMYDAVKKIRGPSGTKIFITIERDGKIIDLPPITREDLKYKTVSYRLIAGAGYIRVKSFNEETADDLESALRALKKQGFNNRAIIDLRDNPGGLVDSVLEMLYYFSKKPDDIVLTIKSKKGEEIHTIKSLYGDFTDSKTYQTKQAGGFSDLKIIILINKGSASASEIFAGTMKDWGAKILGRPSFGKGVGQSIVPLVDKSALRLTTFEFLVGNSKTPVNNKGVLPNYDIEDTRKSPDDTLGDKDLQFKKALEILNQ